MSRVGQPKVFLLVPSSSLSRVPEGTCRPYAIFVFVYMSLTEPWTKFRACGTVVSFLNVVRSVCIRSPLNYNWRQVNSFRTTTTGRPSPAMDGFGPAKILFAGECCAIS